MRRRQVARLHRVIDGLRVEDAAALDLELDAGALELGAQHRQIELHDAESCQVAVVQKLHQARRDVAKLGLSRHVFVADAVHFGRLDGNRHAGIEAAVAHQLAAVRINLEDAELDDAVAVRRSAGGFEIQNRERPLEWDQMIHPVGYDLGIRGRTGCRRRTARVQIVLLRAHDAILPSGEPLAAAIGASGPRRCGGCLQRPEAF
jgi:hypothetical protein